MINYEIIEKNKNKLINFGVIILALIIAFQFHKSTNLQIDTLVQEQGVELEKNKAFEDIAILEKKADIYKKTFVKKDLVAIMDVISGIAKESSVKIVSVKPFAEEARDNYFNSAFLITLSVPSYHALGDFVSKVENHKDIYQVSGISIDSAVSDAGLELDAMSVKPAAASSELSVSMTINTVSYL